MSEEQTEANKDGRSSGLGVPPGWPSLTATERNHLVGETLGMEPLTQCWLGVDGKMLLRTAWDEKQKGEAAAMARMINTYDQLWSDSLADYPSLKPEMRGKLAVIVDRWHLRYSDTPGGGWEVVEWLRKRGPVNVASVAPDWRVAFGDAAATAPTMAEAACLMALSSANTKVSHGA